MIPTLQPATPSDIETLVEFSRALNQEDPDFTGEIHFDEAAVRTALQEFIGDSKLGRAWLILDGDNPIGYVILTMGYSLEYHGRDAFIDEIYITADYRGRGIGTYVMQLVEDEARTLGVNALHLEVEYGNNQALALYQKMGFENHKRRLLTKWIK